MSLKFRLPLVFFFTFFLLLFSVHAHGPSPAHARRSLAFKKKLHRQLDIPGALGDISDEVGDLLGNTGPSTPDPRFRSTPSTDTTSPTTDPANTDPPSTTPPSSDAPSTTPPPSTSPPPSPDTSTSTPSTTSSGTSSSLLSSSTPSSDGSSCLLGLDLFGNCVLSVSSSSTSSQTTDSPPSPPTDSPTSQTTSTSSSPPASSPDTPTPTPTLDCPLGLVINGECVLPSSSSSTPPPSASSPSLTSEPPPSIPLPSITPDPDSSSSPPTTNPESPTPAPSSSPPIDPCGSVGRLLGLCSSNSSPPASTPPSISTPQTSPSANPPNSSSQSAPSPTSTPYQPVEPCGSLGIDLGLCTSLPSSATTSQPPSQPTGSSSSPPGSSLSSSFSPPALPTGSSVFTVTPPESCGPLGLCGSTTTSDSGTTVPSSPPGTQSQPSPSGQSGSSLTTSFPSGIPTSWSGTVSSSMSGSSDGTSLSSPPVIAFPSTNDTVSSTTSFSSTPTSGPSFPSFTPSPQGQLSYVTQASLLGTPVPTSSPVTLSDPDAVPPTLTIVSASNLPSTTTPVLLPSNLPARIYPPTQVDPNSLSGFSLVSILFDQFLSWSFVAQNTQSQGQLFLWLPTIIQSALGLPSEQVKTFALQVFLPATYSGPADVDMLQTTFLLYIPSGQVPVLANQIKVISSPFYTSLGEPYKTLASHVNPAYSLTSVQDPNAVPGTGTTSSVNSSGNKSRTDAIIGVASALGGLALVVLGVLIYRSVKRSRDLSHRRLSDPNAPNVPYPDRTGRDFDQDSVGGQRRRSFYFAEDSLRGQQAVQQTAVPVTQPQHEASQVEYSYRTSPDGVRERRAPVVTGAISAPILTQSSLNW
ncbi:hypothetical protein EDB92DRAFT_1820751 [Lactarius akahatsu]|uniref:Uncharacterized protein n=1 Tax=Lactarius akahatsu TaxID=416441 RepID=A0AAD4L7D3_9AGAM|nr:hypothetical protein EDB92DRAFT_1820751 [Lactarius akahatsu]